MTRGTDPRRASKQRFAELNEFVDSGMTTAGLTPAASVVWLVLFRFARDHKVSVPVIQIERTTGLCKRTVLRSIAELRAKRMLKTMRKGGMGRGASEYLLSPHPMIQKRIK